MLSSARLVKFGIPALVAVLALAAMGLWVFMGGATGQNDNGKVSVNVSWTVRDALGNVKSQGAGHNFTSINLLNAARTRLSAAGDPGATGMFANIALMSVAQTGISANGGAATVAGTLSTNAGTNPVLAGITTSNPSATTSRYTANTTFTAAGAVTINELELSKNLQASTAPLVADIGAVKGVTIVLAVTDTLQITWDVTIS